MKKFISLLGTVAIVFTMLSAYTFGVEAAVEKPTFTLEFTGFTTAGTSSITYFANIDVWAEFPGTLTPYTVHEADWENTFEDTYEGRMVQGIQANVDLGTGFSTFVPSKSVPSSTKSSDVSGLTLTKNASINQVVYSVLYTGAYNTYYAGASKVKLGTICYRITDLDASNTVSLTTGQATIYDIAEDGSATPHIYAMSDSNIVLGSSVVVPPVNTPSDPVVAEKDTTTGVVTFDYTNATQPASDVLDGQQIKLFSETFTGVTANTRFRVNHNDTYKIFGSTIGEYLGIGGSGTLSGTLGVAVLFPEGDNSDFTISKID